jgi:hypothetical protein
LGSIQDITSGFRNFLFARREVARLESMRTSTPGGLELVFYAESKNDWIYFEGLVLELVERRGRSVVYLTSSRDDRAFDVDSDNLHVFYIGDGFARTLLFQSIACRVFVMTLTDLDQLFLKRSVHGVHYVYLFHAVVSAHMVYRERSFNAYDTFFAVGPHHAREIPALHRFYGIDEKRVVPFGYYRLEKLLNDNAGLADRTSDPDHPHILIAPSWGPHSITRTVVAPLIRELLQGGCRVTYRPHPMSHRKDPEILAALKKEFGSDDAVEFDFDIRSSVSLEKADLMISDWSGSAFEFAFGFERPVLFVDTEPKVNNGDFDAFMEAQTAPMEPLEKTLRTLLGDIVSPDRLGEVNEKIQRLLSSRETTHGRLMESRNESIYNLGNSSIVGADHLVDLIEKS